MRTYEFTCARDGDLYQEDILAASLDDAQGEAVALINKAWAQSYADWDDMAADSDGCDMVEHEAVMAERLPLDTMQLYRRLADGLSDMVEGGRLSEGDIPDDYAWLVHMLEKIAGADPGETVLPSHMRLPAGALTVSPPCAAISKPAQEA